MSYIDELIEKAFSDGYEYAQREFNSKAQKARRLIADLNESKAKVVDLLKENSTTDKYHGLKELALKDGRLQRHQRPIGRFNLNDKINHKQRCVENNKKDLDHIDHLKKEIRKNLKNGQLTEAEYNRNWMESAQHWANEFPKRFRTAVKWEHS